MGLFGYKLKLYELITFAILIILILAIPSSVYLVKKTQILKSKATSNFNVGVNIVGITHLGPDDMEANLAEIARMGGKVVRVFAPKDEVSHEVAAQRLDDFLSRAQRYGITVIVALIDFYGSGYRPQGTEGFYTDNFNGIPLLNHDFFAGGYRGAYKQFIETVVSRNKHHSNIYAWEIGNELKDDKSPETFIDFMKDIASTIKNLDPGHSIASGMLSAGHANLSPEALYNAVPDINIVTIHMYNGNRAGEQDTAWAQVNGKVFIDEEAGYSGSGDRTSQMRDEIEFWKSRGAAAILQWGFIAGGLGDNGFGDRDFGMDTIWHSDYNNLFSLYQSFNGGGNPAPPPGGGSCNIDYQSPSLKDSCSACLSSKDPGLAGSFKSLNPSKFNSCSTKELLAYWCNGGISPQAMKDCLKWKSACGASCAGEWVMADANCQDSCSNCVLQYRDDILPFFLQNQWDVRCQNYSKIVSNWCGIDPKGCSDVKNNNCKSSCSGGGATVSPSPAVGGTIYGVIWDDTKGNTKQPDGVRQPDEPLISGIKVCVRQLTSSDPANCTVTQDKLNDAKGNYKLTGVAAGSRKVFVDSSSF
ncbi:MAG: hypothetical protein UT04_C0002G0001, partial [Candidatus Daviesbacteria bacterium GW2011_GWF2_38_7]